MKDIDIARSVTPLPIEEIAKKLSIDKDDLEFYGKYKAKLKIEADERPKGKLILVSATNPTPFGEGKTTVSVGLADALSRLNKKVCLALRQPSLGPVFGVKGGAAGGGYAQVIPMEDINLHFTGDFHAITSANNLLSCLIDNHIKQGNELSLDLKRIEWKRALDLNDRALRNIIVGEGGEVNGVPREDGFNITAASEIMAILCLAKDLEDLKERLGDIVIAYNKKGEAVTARQLRAESAMTILLKDAIYPNLVQTLEGTPAIIHGGPFANIAHGCNSIRATKISLSKADYTVTEAGFGADLGAEKFIDIKCRAAGISPDAVVLVTTVRALKHNGGGEGDALFKGISNLFGHIENLKEVFGAKVTVAINKFITDTEEELCFIKEEAEKKGVRACVTECWAKGGAGSTELALEVLRLTEEEPRSEIKFCYDLALSVQQKIEAVAQRIYGAKFVVFSEKAISKIKLIENLGYDKLPVCIAKTQYSFSQDATLLGRPKDFTFEVKDIELRAGSKFIVVIAGNILLMPGLSKEPAAVRMTIDKDGKIEGLF